MLLSALLNAAIALAVYFAAQSAALAMAAFLAMTIVDYLVAYVNKTAIDASNKVALKRVYDEAGAKIKDLLKNT